MWKLAQEKITSMSLLNRRAQPMKKKKKVDPAITRIREERKRRKLWRECRRLMKFQKQLKPLDEMEIPYVLVDDRE